MIELKQAPLEGELNINAFYRTRDDRVVLRRYPKDNKAILESIDEEYKAIGFFDQGGKYRMRKLKEQCDFARHAASLGLHVLQPSDDTINEYAFKDNARTLDYYLPSASPEKTAKVIFELFKDLRHAHSHNVIYGDRWSPNILIFPDATILHVDLDIEISGHCAKEFELAQLTYYTLCAGGAKIIPELAEELYLDFDRLDFNLVAKFLEGHARHFANDEKYGRMENETKTLIDLVHKKQHHT